MIIVGCDYHPGFQQIAFVDTDTGELQERRLQHREEAENFYCDLAAQGMKPVDDSYRREVAMVRLPFVLVFRQRSSTERDSAAARICSVTYRNNNLRC
jgi:hypothetical protein